jgi:hypothetical protein
VDSTRILPVQWFRLRRETSGEERLLMAVLELAVMDVRGEAGSDDSGGSVRWRNVRRMTRRKAAERWMTLSQPRWPGSFIAICQVLRLDAGAVRRAVGL